MLWLKLGEAPTKYFFNQLKAKHRRESIKMMQLSHREVTEDEDKILKEIFMFYPDLCCEDKRVEDHCASTEATLGLITERGIDTNNQLLGSVPSDDEIKLVVHSFPQEKAPGMDGVTIKMLLKVWEYKKPLCCSMVKAIWLDGKVTTRASVGVIKVIPKNQNTLELINWRPLTMLTLTEKIIAKVLANRFKKVVGRLVDK